MRRFRFALETVLRWRQSRLEAEQARLGELVTELERIRLRIRQAEEDAQAAARDVLGAGAIPAAELAALEAYLRRLVQERARLSRAEADCQARIAAQRECVVEAQRQVRVIEKLRERRFEEWRTELDRETETLAAEAYLAQWGRR